jgi:hypothetical protein
MRTVVLLLAGLPLLAAGDAGVTPEPAAAARPQAPGSRPSSASKASAARAAWERFRELEGTWIGESTKGWRESVSFRTIAGGSALVETSFDAHPNETMLTIFQLDGDDLVLTHYCVAKNQPHLRATAFSEDGRTVTFTFAGGGNLADRNRGHMDQAVFQFDSPDRISSKWTWYQNGTKRWLEEIHLERRR